MRGRRAIVIALLLLSAPAAARAPRPPRTLPPAAVEPAPPPPPALPPATSPLDATLVWPALEGASEGLDITKMVRSRVRYDLAVDRAWLASVPADQLDLVLAVLEADPRWRVTELEGLPCAVRREDSEEGPQVSRTGYHRTDGERWRTMLRTEPWPEQAPWATSKRVVRVDAAAGPIPLDAWVDDVTGIYGARTTALTLASPVLALDVYELGPAGSRPRTVEALLDAADLLGWIVAKLPDVQARGVDGMPLPSGEPGSGTFLDITSPGPGLLDVRGRTNPGTRGWTWLRVMTPQGAWAETEVGAGTRERIGASEISTYSFWFQGQLAAPAGPAFPATAELWHLADGASAARLLSTWPVTVPAR